METIFISKFDASRQNRMNCIRASSKYILNSCSQFTVNIEMDLSMVWYHLFMPVTRRDSQIYKVPLNFYMADNYIETIFVEMNCDCKNLKTIRSQITLCLHNVFALCILPMQNQNKNKNNNMLWKFTWN